MGRPKRKTSSPFTGPRVFRKVGSAESEPEIWRTDPVTLRDVLLDSVAIQERLVECPPLERAWLLSLLGHDEEAIASGHRLLAEAPDRFRVLLVLAQAYQRNYQWHMAQLQEEALRLAHSLSREALARHHIGRRLFNEARYGDAAHEFQWAGDLYRTNQRHRLAEASYQAMERALEWDHMR